MANLPRRPPVRMIIDTNALTPIDDVPSLHDISHEFTALSTLMSVRAHGGRIQPGQHQSIGGAVMRFQYAVNTRWADEVGIGNNNQFQALDGQVQALGGQVQNLLNLPNQVQIIGDQVQNLLNQPNEVQNILNQLLQGQQQLLQGQQHMQAQFNAARTNDIAQQMNGQIFSTGILANYRGLVKYNPGHPDPNPPVGLISLFDHLPLNINNIPPNGYAVGDAPPLGLTPTNKAEFDFLSLLGDEQKLISLRGIAWFYNDNHIQIGADHHQIYTCFEAYKRFFFGR